MPPLPNKKKYNTNVVLGLECRRPNYYILVVVPRNDSSSSNNNMEEEAEMQQAYYQRERARGNLRGIKEERAWEEFLRIAIAAAIRGNRRILQYY